MTPQPTINELQHQLWRLGEAQSAIAQCCIILGEHRTNQILKEISGVTKEIIDRINAIQEPA